jgi:hypothetical protein
MAVIGFLALVVAWSPATAFSQSDNATAVALLPEAAVFGDGWSQLATDFPRERHPAFRAAATATYGGPRGARIVVDVMLVAEGMVAARESWERANAYLQWYDANMLPDANPQRDQELADMPPPPGCADALRLEGRERIGSTAFPIGVNVCAVDPDAIYVAAVSGDWDGSTGVSAADAVIAQLTSPATPVP